MKTLDELISIKQRYEKRVKKPFSRVLEDNHSIFDGLQPEETEALSKLIKLDVIQNDLSLLKSISIKSEHISNSITDLTNQQDILNDSLLEYEDLEIIRFKGSFNDELNKEFDDMASSIIENKNRADIKKIINELDSYGKNCNLLLDEMGMVFEDKHFNQLCDTLYTKLSETYKSPSYNLSFEKTDNPELNEINLELENINLPFPIECTSRIENNRAYYDITLPKSSDGTEESEDDFGYGENASIDFKLIKDDTQFSVDMIKERLSETICHYVNDGRYDKATMEELALSNLPNSHTILNHPNCTASHPDSELNEEINKNRKKQSNTLKLINNFKGLNDKETAYRIVNGLDIIHKSDIPQISKSNDYTVKTVTFSKGLKTFVRQNSEGKIVSTIIDNKETLTDYGKLKL